MSSDVGKPLFWIILALAFCGWSLATQEVTLGLDLRGGATMRYELQASEDQVLGGTDVDEMISTTIDTLRRRIDAYGIRESSITRQGDNEITIELPGSGKDETETIKSVISRVGRLEWRIMATDDVRRGLSVEEERTRLEEFLAANAGKGPSELDLTSLDRSFDDVVYRWVPYSDNILAQRRGVEELGDGEVLATAPLTVADFGLIKIESGRSRNFTGVDIAAARQSTDNRGNPAVGVAMKANRAAEFGDWTEENKGQLLAIVLDGRMAESPATINDRLEGDFVIQSGKPTGFSPDEIRDYLTIIRSGSLQLKPKLLYENTIGPSLGESSIQTGVQAGLWGSLAVVLFTLFYYRINGLIAVLCLLVNMMMLAGILMFLGATITLPGIAGLVLTMGMAIDANILVFERLREETDRSKGIAQSVKLGFEKAVPTILDANITTFVTAFILFKLGTGPVRGFAVVLMFGIATSVFSVLVFGKAMYLFLIEREWLPSVAMGRLVKKDTNVGFMSKAKVASKLSIVAVAVSLAGFFAAGDETFGLDFLGGYKAQVRLSGPATQGEISEAVGAAFPGAQVVSVLGDEDFGNNQADQFVIKVKGNAAAATEDEDTDDLQAAFQQPLKQALAGRLRPDFVQQLELTEDEATANTAMTATLRFEGRPDTAAVANVLGFLGDLETTAAGDDGVSIAGTLPGTGLDSQFVVQRLFNAVSGAAESGVLPPPSRPFIESTTIGSRVGVELRDSAIRAIILSFLVIVLYIRVRFKEYRYGIAAIVALAHDVSITLGAVALVHYLGFVDIEIDLPMIAAFLTIVGYSLNDTIVLFDRVRENLPRIDRPLNEVLDISVNQCLSRTLLTSITTLLVLGVIFTLSLGGQHILEGFSFAMIIGVLVGTYSSIFVASPIVAMIARKHGEATA